jgi:hypothetical protein
MTTSKATPSARDTLEDRYLTFNCYQFSRGVRAGRPTSRRWVSAEQCLCTHDEENICDPTLLYSFHFYEISDQEEAAYQNDPDIPLGRIGIFRPEASLIHVPTDFFNVLWTVAIAADGVLRSINLTVQPQKQGLWAIFEATLHEQIEEPFELRFDDHSRPKPSPPRAFPAVTELRALRAQLKLPVWPAIAVIAVGVSVALWIAKLWH